MLTPVEISKLRAIKTLVKAGNEYLVPAADKQWVLDIVKRERAPIRAAVVERAVVQGYDTTGLVVA